jgi:maltooligosyltrehalose trehalohydrolase
VSAIRVWAPTARRVLLHADGEFAMEPDGAGWWVGPELAPGTDYSFSLDDDPDHLPDPASRWQPTGVHGPSRSYDQSAYHWQDGAWAGRDLHAAVIYELHIGTFTPGATFDSAVERLPYLAALGITHVEVLPVNAVNGIWNWGYDGVDWYAVHEPYGGPDGFKRFADACHRHGLAVILDVVYNHLGPSGNYLSRFGPYLQSGRNTWGELVNLEEPAVRRFIIDNALMWLRDFHTDGLRLDAVHALVDSSPTHLLAELSGEIDALAAELGRPLTLIAESDLNDPVMITPRPHGYGLHAQWDDDVHHALHGLLTGERQGYYCDFGSLAVLAKTLTKAFLHDGTYSTFRSRTHGRPVDPAVSSGDQFVVCLQNHDQVGNRAVGDRITELTSHAQVRIGVLLLLTGPFTPMLWMGEEWAASARWPFFTSHPQPELAATTGPGRIAEFAEYGWDVSSMIDPQDPRAYRETVLDWDELAQEPHATMLAWYATLIALRAAEPDLRDADLRRVQVDFDEDAQWLLMHRGEFLVLINLGDVEHVFDTGPARVVLSSAGAQVRDQAVAVAPQSGALVRLE